MKINERIIDGIKYVQYEKESANDFCSGTYTIKSMFIAKALNKNKFKHVYHKKYKDYDRPCFCDKCNNHFNIFDCKYEELLDASSTYCPFCMESYECFGYTPFNKLCEIIDKTI